MALMPIDRKALDTYLNDHLAASVAALQLMQRICDAQDGTPLGASIERLRVEVLDDQEIVRGLLVAEGGSEATVKQAMAWAGEKLSHLKVGGNDIGSGLMLFEALEALSVGFWGRHALWRGLAHVDAVAPLGSGIDFGALADRAKQHLSELEPLRLDAARHALSEAREGTRDH